MIEDSLARLADRQGKRIIELEAQIVRLVDAGADAILKLAYCRRTTKETQENGPWPEERALRMAIDRSRSPEAGR